MKIIDSHCHLDRVDLEQFNGSFAKMLQMANEKHVQEFLCVCINLEDFDKVLQIAKKYPHIYASVGVHPTEILALEPSFNDILKLTQDNNIIAIGETGLDYFHIKSTDADWQRERFITHIKVANQCDKPLIVHTREAKEDTIAILQQENAHSGIMHCFVEDKKTAAQVIELGFYISFSGVLTFKNAKNLQEVAKTIPLDKLLVETDSPYLAPSPMRGKPNHPANTYFVLEKLAQLRNLSIKEMAEITSNNFYKLFKNLYINKDD